MSVINMVKVIKEIYPTSVTLIKTGKFYQVYGKDSYILAYTFNYKIRNIESTCPTCGFPEGAINKVQASLENKKINYICVLASHNYEIVEEMNFKNNNQYGKYFEEARKNLNLKKRVDAIYNKIIQHLNNEKMKIKIKQIEEIINNEI